MNKPGSLKPYRAATAQDVARLAGVSRSAVSRAFTEGASVAPDTRRKVLEAAQTLGYRVNFLARSLSRQKTSLIGLVISDIDNPFRAALMDRIARHLIAINYRPFILPTDAGEDASHLIDMMLHYNVSGAIVTGDAPPAEIAEECAAHGVPLVLINKPVVGTNVANVSMNTAMAGQLAAEELKRVGCRSVILASQVRRSYSVSQRRDHFLEHATRIGLLVTGEFWGDVHNYGGGRQAASAFLASHHKADGVYCANDYFALGFIDEVRRSSLLRVPEDLRVVACDDIEEASWLGYDLTTIRQDPEAMATAIVDALVRQINTAPMPVNPFLVDVTLIRRSSTG